MTGPYDEWYDDEDKPVVAQPQPEQSPQENIIDLDAEASPPPHIDNEPEQDAVADDNDAEPDSASLPTDLASREQDTSLKPRFKGHAPLNAMVRKDWIRVIEMDPDNFDALLFRPDPEDVGEIDDDTGLEGSSFTEISNNQRDLRYLEPIKVKVVDCPDERDSFQAVDVDGEQDGLAEEIQLLRIAAEGVCVGSILTWNEEMASGNLAQRWWYVHRIFSFGTQHVGSLYYCIPARNLDSTEGGRVK